MDIHDSLTVLAFPKGYENVYLVGDYYYDHDGTRGVIQEVDEKNHIFCVNPAPTREEYERIMHRRKNKIENYTRTKITNTNTLQVLGIFLSSMNNIRNKNTQVQREVQKSIDVKNECIARTMKLEEEVLNLTETIKKMKIKIRSNDKKQKKRNFHGFNR